MDNEDICGAYAGGAERGFEVRHGEAQKPLRVSIEELLAESFEAVFDRGRDHVRRLVQNQYTGIPASMIPIAIALLAGL